MRTERELTQKQAAERVGLSEKHLRRIELGKANVTLATLTFSIVYGLSLRTIVGAST
ncbi:MAG: hypothetical protein CMN31_21675 [Sandaracinus sp.]|nr:hypothetical protein [Sandaracinus sp.]MBJ73900.1 hypothetical protein [Sandaracinus sp.]